MEDGGAQQEVLRVLPGRGEPAVLPLPQVTGHRAVPRVLLRGAATTAAAATTDTSWCTAGASRSRPEAEGGWTSREEQLLLNAIEQFVVLTSILPQKTY